MDINIYKKKPGRRSKSNPDRSPSAVVYLDADERRRLADLSGQSGMEEADYLRCVLEHALEYGMRDDSWLDDGKPGVLPGRRKRV